MQKKPLNFIVFCIYVLLVSFTSLSHRRHHREERAGALGAAAHCVGGGSARGAAHVTMLALLVGVLGWGLCGAAAAYDITSWAIAVAQPLYVTRCSRCPGGSGPSPSSRSRPPSCSASAGSSSHGGLDTLARRSLRSVSRRRHSGAGAATHHPSRCHRRRAPHGPAAERRRPPCSALEPSRPRRQIRRRHGLPHRFLTREALSRPRQASSAVAQAVPRRSHLPAARQRRRPRNRGAGRRANPPPPPRLRSIPLASGSTATSPSHPTSRPGSSTLEQLAARAAAGTTAGARGQAATAGPWTRPPSTRRPGPLRGVSGCGLPRRLPSPDGGSTKARSGRPLARRRRQCGAARWP